MGFKEILQAIKNDAVNGFKKFLRAFKELAEFVTSDTSENVAEKIIKTAPEPNATKEALLKKPTAEQLVEPTSEEPAAPELVTPTIRGAVEDLVLESGENGASAVRASEGRPTGGRQPGDL